MRPIPFLKMKTHLLVAAVAAALIAPAGRTTTSAHGVSDGRHGVNFIAANHPAYDVSEQEWLADQLAATGVRWAQLSVQWFMSEPDAPLSYDDGGRWQGPSGKWHRYYLSNLDAVVYRLPPHVNIVMSLFNHPTWAGGQSEPGFCIACNIIYNYKKAEFSQAVADLAAHLRWRYRDRPLAAFAPWNEPNNHFFSPEPPYNPDYLSEYLNLVHIPVRKAIRNIESQYGLSSVLIVGPELAGPNNGNGWADNYWNTPVEDGGCGRCYSGAHTHWITHWTRPLLQFVPSVIDVFSFHTYHDDYHAPASQVAQVQSEMFWTTWKPIWLTESNIKSEGPYYGDRAGETTIANYFCEVYRRMDGNSWQRTFVFGLHDGDYGIRGKSLLSSRRPGYWQPKWLHEAFHAITDGNYSCNGT